MECLIKLFLAVPRRATSVESYQSHCDICHTDYRVTLTSGKIAPKTRYFGWNIASLSQSSISFSNVPPKIS